MIRDDKSEFESNSNSAQPKFELNSKLILIQPNQLKLESELKDQIQVSLGLTQVPLNLRSSQTLIQLNWTLTQTPIQSQSY